MNRTPSCTNGETQATSRWYSWPSTSIRKAWQLCFRAHQQRINSNGGRPTATLPVKDFIMARPATSPLHASGYPQWRRLGANVREIFGGETGQVLAVEPRATVARRR